MNRFFLIFLIFIAQNSSAQLLNSKYNQREVNCYSPEINIYISNQGKEQLPQNKPIQSQNFNDKLQKFNNGINTAIAKKNKRISGYKQLNQFDDVMTTGLTSAVKEFIPGSSILVDPIKKIADYQRQELIADYERKQETEVRKKLINDFNQLENSSTKEELIELINNEDDKLFEISDNTTLYNRKLIQLVNKLGEEESTQIKNEMNLHHQALVDLYKKYSEGISLIADVETKAIDAFLSNKKIIENNKNKIQVNKSNIEKNKLLIEQNSLRVSILESAMLEQNKLLNQNAEDIKDIKTLLTYEREPLTEKIEGLKKGKYDRLFRTEGGQVDTVARNNLIKETENFKLRKDINLYAQSASAWGQVASKTLTTFFPETDPDIVNTINYGVQAANIIGCAASGNYAGAVLQTLGMFGKNKQSQESIMLGQIMGQLRTMRKEMHERFNRIEESLEIIHKDLSDKLIYIANYIEEMNHDIHELQAQTLNELYIIESKLDYLEDKIDCLDSKIIEVLSKEVNTCEQPYWAIKERMIENYPDNFNQFRQIITDYKCQSCISALEDFFNTMNRKSHLFDEIHCDPSSSGLTEMDIYNKIMIIWNAQWNRKYNNDATIALLYPPINTVENVSLLTSIHSNENKDYVLNFNLNGFKKKRYRWDNNVLKSPMQICQIGEYLLTFYPFLEIHKGTREFYTYEELLENPKSKESLKYLSNYFYNISDVIDFSIAQQSLMSGHLIIPYFAKFLNLPDPYYSEIIMDILNNNPIAATNFANYIIALNYSSIPDSFDNLILIDQKNYRIELLHKDNYHILSIKKNIIKNGIKSEISSDIALNTLTQFNENPKFIFTEGFYQLMKLKEKLDLKITEIEFILNLNDTENNNTLSKYEYRNLLNL